MNLMDKIIKLPRTPKASRRIRNVLRKWVEEHESRRWKRVILVTEDRDGVVGVSDAGFRVNEEHVFRGMIDYVKDSWGWGSDNE